MRLLLVCFILVAMLAVEHFLYVRESRSGLCVPDESRLSNSVMSACLTTSNKNHSSDKKLTFFRMGG